MNTISRANIPICNLYCCNCVEVIKKELLKIENISNIDISVQDSLIRFNFIKPNDLSTVENSLTFLGFPPKGDRIKKSTETICFCIKKMKSS